MARKPNYKFERLERQRAKDIKKAARLEAKREKAEKRKAGGADTAPDDAMDGAKDGEGLVETPGNLPEDDGPAM